MHISPRTVVIVAAHPAAHSSSLLNDRRDIAPMNLRPWTPLSLLYFPMIAKCVEEKDLSPPPFNPHPKDAIHITASFDHP
jgi:hypothetical protein